MNAIRKQVSAIRKQVSAIRWCPLVIAILEQVMAIRVQAGVIAIRLLRALLLIGTTAVQHMAVYVCCTQTFLMLTFPEKPTSKAMSLVATTPNRAQS